MKIYVASSWRNPRHPTVVEALRAAGHEVYDYRNPEPDNHGFSWHQITPSPRPWLPSVTRVVLEHPIARHAFRLDHGAMEWSDAVVMVLPCGKSAHLELGWACGAGKLAIVLQEEPDEPELMYREILATGGGLCSSIDEVLVALAAQRRVPAHLVQMFDAAVQLAVGSLVSAVFEETQGLSAQDQATVGLALTKATAKLVEWSNDPEAGGEVSRG